MAARVSDNNAVTKVIDSHLHVWASPEEAAEKYPYFPGLAPSIPGTLDLLLECMEEAGIDGAFVVQPIYHMFDHSYVTSALKRYPYKFVGCCLANPAEDGCGIKQLEDLVLKDGYRAVRFNPDLWPSGQKMTNGIGKALFSKAGELGIPVGFLCNGGLNMHHEEIERLCEEYPSTVVLMDHMGLCQPPLTDEEHLAFSSLLKLSRFPQVYVKFSAFYRISREQFPYLDLCSMLSKLVSTFGAERLMWGSDFPFAAAACGYKNAKEAMLMIGKKAEIPSSEMNRIMCGTITSLFPGRWDVSS